MKTKKHTLWGAVLFFGYYVATALPLNANLLITPLQVVMENRTRSHEIILINPTNDTNTYRLSWEQLDMMNETGGYEEVSEEENKKRTDLMDFAVYTPRQITLEPNEKQTIRVAVRRPADLPEGEYKSHLKFGIMPELTIRNSENETDSADNKSKFVAQMYASFLIPVIYRNGEYDCTITLKQPTFSINESNSRLMVHLPVERSGLHGVVGLINIYHTPNGGEEKVIVKRGNANIFAEVDYRLFDITTTETSLQPGTMRIEFIKSEGKLANYEVMDEMTFPVQ